MSALVFEGVVKQYGRGKRALDGLSFSVPRGVVCGLVGPNGAGKTTAFSVVSGFLPTDEGTVDILGGGPFDPWAFKGRLGVLPQDAELPERHSPTELLTHLARLQGLGAKAARAEAELRIAQVNLADRAGDHISTLSHGMRRRVAVASALLGSPELVMLDEPLAGLDPVQAKSLREALISLGGKQTLIISSHNLVELERMCDWVVMMDRGRCIRSGSVAEVTAQGERLLWSLGPGEVPLEALQAALEGHHLTLADAQLSLTLGLGADPDTASLTVMSHLVAAGISVREMRRGVSLEDTFVRDTAAHR